MHMQRRAPLLLLLLAGAAGVAAQEGDALDARPVCPLKGSLFPTGVDDAGAKLAKGAADAHWVAYKPGSPQPLKLEAAPLALANEDTFGWAHDDDDAGRAGATLGTSQWIGAYDKAAALYRFDHAFAVPTHADLSTVAVDAQLAASYAVLSVELNGQPIYQNPDPILGSVPGRQLAQSLRLPALTKHDNTLSVVVLPGGTKKRGFVSVWFPNATFRPVEGVAGCEAPPAPAAPAAPVEPEPEPERAPVQLPPESVPEEESQEPVAVSDPVPTTPEESVEEPEPAAAAPVVGEPAASGVTEAENVASGSPEVENIASGSTEALNGRKLRRASVVDADGHVTGLEDRLAHGLFTPQEQRRRGLQEEGEAAATLSAVAAEASEADAGAAAGPSCRILDLRPTVDPTTKTSTWQGYFRFYDAGNAQGPWAPATQALQDGEIEEDWVVLGRPAFANWIFYETNFTLPAGVDPAAVKIAGHLGADLLALGIYVNGQPAWLNPSPFAPPAKASDPVPFSLHGACFVSGVNTLAVAVLADPAESYRSMLRVAFNTAAFAGCGESFQTLALDGSAAPPEQSGAVCSEGCRVVSTTALPLTADASIAGLAVDAKSRVAYVTWAGWAAGNGGLTRHAVGNGTAALPGAWPAADVPALDEPGDVAVGPSGEVYVLEGGARIRAFEGKTGKLRGEWGPLTEATGLAVLPAGPDGATWVYTIDDGKIKGFSTGESGQTAAFTGCWKEKSGTGALTVDVDVCPEDPIDLAISFDASAGVPGTEAPPTTIWVVDQGLGMIHLYDLAGTRVGVINDGKASTNLFKGPRAVSVDSYRGLAYVMDETAQEVVVVDRRGKEWHRFGSGVVDRCGFFSQQRLLDSTALKATAPQEFHGGAEVGIEIAVRRPGSLRAIRYYRAAAETGAHTATVWGADGRPLASVAFPPDDAAAATAGWATVYLEDPLELDAGVAYTVSVNVNAWATALTTLDSRGALDNGKDLLTSGAPGGRVSPAAGQFPTEVASVHYVDVEVETEPYLSSLVGVGTLGAAFDPTVAQAQGGGLTYYANHVDDTTAEVVVGLRCSGYPPHMGDCASDAQLAGLDARLLDDVKTALEGHPSVLGFSFWGGKYALHPELDHLQEGAALAKELGAGSIGLWMGGGLDPAEVYPFHSPAWPKIPAASLTELAQLPYYKAVLDDPAIKTYVINAYAVSTGGIGLKLRFGTFSEEDAAKERAEFGNFTQYLASTYAETGKTFILQAWSLDAFLADSTKSELVPEWGAVAATWLNARQAGVEAGRAAAGQEPKSVAVYHAVQVSRGVLDKSKGLVTPWAVDRLLPSITVDLVSWAAFEASRQRDPSLLAAGIATLNTAVRRSAQGYQLDGLDFPRPDKAQVRVFISEIGEPDARLKGEPEASKQLLPGAIKAAVAANVPVILYWAGYGTEAAASSAAPLPWTEAFQGAWLKRPDGTPSFAFCYLQAVAGKV